MHIVVSLIFGTTLLVNAEQAFDRGSILGSDLPAIAMKPENSSATEEITDAETTVVEIGPMVEVHRVDADATEADVEDADDAETELSVVEPESVASDVVGTADQLVNAWPHLSEETRVAILMLVKADEMMRD